MTQSIKSRQKPAIVIADTDHVKLSALAAAATDRLPEAAEELQTELDRAKVKPGRLVPRDVVRMGSSVAYETDTGERRNVTLVFPPDADIGAGRISILTPVGTALIGLSTGQSMNWTTRDGRRHRLTIVDVNDASAEVVPALAG